MEVGQKVIVDKDLISEREVKILWVSRKQTLVKVTDGEVEWYVLGSQLTPISTKTGSHFDLKGFLKQHIQ